MRTDDSRPRASAPSRLRDGAKRLWHWLSAQKPTARLTLAGGALALLVAAGYLVSATPPAEETAWLYEGHSLSSEAAQRALSALAVAKIPARAGARGQIAVPVARRADALALLTKQKLGPTSLHELQAEAATESIFTPYTDRGERRERLLQREAEIMISDLEGIASADVQINRAPGRSPGSRTGKVAALVRIHPVDGQSLTAQSLHAIQAILKSIEPDLAPDALTVLDRAGRPYLVGGNPEAGAKIMAHVHEQDLGGKIARQLDWIAGVRVSVTMTMPPPSPVAAPPVAVAVATPPVSPSVVVNGPAQVDEPAPSAPPSPSPPPPPSLSPSPLPSPEIVMGKAMILVQVPISHYLRSYRATHRHEPSLDELKPYVAKVEDSIRSTIHFVLPAAEIASLKVDRIDDPGPAAPAIPAADESALLRFRQWWLPAAASLGLVLVMMAAMGTRWLATRRPAEVATAVPRAHFEVGDNAGPSGRVRELVRRDPAAAAGVLHRWIGQGGASS